MDTTLILLALQRSLLPLSVRDLPLDFTMYPQIWPPEGTVHVYIAYLKQTETTKKCTVCDFVLIVYNVLFCFLGDFRPPNAL